MGLFDKKSAAKKGQRTDKPIAGELRQSQLLNTYGIGSVVDFLNNTVVIAGTDGWKDEEDLRLYNESLQDLTGAEYFLQPKPAKNVGKWEKSRDIPSYTFPEILYCGKCNGLYHINDVRNEKGTYKCNKCKNDLVASRFIMVCENGHMQDFPYYWWVHRGEECNSSSKLHNLTMYNRDDRADIDSLMVRCQNCGSWRNIREAFNENFATGYYCRGIHPHLMNQYHFSQNGCNERLKIKLRSASGNYFPVIQSALSIPPWSRKAIQLIERKYNDIIHAADIKSYIKDCVLPDDNRYTLDLLLNAFTVVDNHKKAHSGQTMKNVLYNEYQVLALGGTQSVDDYSAREVDVPQNYSNVIEKIVAVDKLTVISALCGFTREKPWSGASLDDERIAPLSMEKKKWLPGAVMKGEGIFLKFNIDVINNWKSVIGSRYQDIFDAYEESYFYEERLSEQYIFLHTFSHMLMRQLSAECGYNTASLKERIYSTFDKMSNNDMAGILIYLSTPDSEGSLGGLISVAENTDIMENILDNMSRKGLWCSNDPICINSKEQGVYSLNYAACHDCALLPEVSCENRNVFLDRVAVVGKPDNRELGILGQMAGEISM